MLGEREPRASFEHCEQHRESTRVKTLRATAWWDAARDGIGERLHLDEERALAFECRHDDRAWRPGTAVGEEHLAGIGNTCETSLGHLEESELARRTEAVLDGAEQPQRMVAVTFEGEHGVDDVFEHPRTSEATFFRDVSDEDHGDVATFCFLNESIGASADLNDRARCRPERWIGNCLDAVDHDQGWCDTVDRRDDVRERGFGK